MPSQPRQPSQLKGDNPRRDTKIAVLCDFDDTIAQQNVAHLILERFGDGSWKDVQRRYRDGRATAEEYFEKPFVRLNATRDEMQAHVRVAGHLRSGFLDLAKYCRERDIPMAVVTAGFDFYVEALLEQHDLGWVATYTVGTRFTPQGMEFDFRHARDGCERWGICKCSVVDLYREQERLIVYVGDGRNDLCPARKADVVFARDVLKELCVQEGIPHIEFSNFTDVLVEIDKLRVGGTTQSAMKS